MKENYLINQNVVLRLQNEAKQLLQKSKLVFWGVVIILKEIESYYFEDGEFMDNSVHRNELQKNNSNHFYIHRKGKKRIDSYKGGKYPGIDFVVSNDDNIYYSYLIRSAVINGKLVVGPHKVLEEIQNVTKLSYNDIEKETIILEPNIIAKDVFFSERINLGKTVLKEYKECKLRAVICDDLFREKGTKYPKKEELIINFLSNANMTKEEAMCYAKINLGYIPSSIK